MTAPEIRSDVSAGKPNDVVGNRSRLADIIFANSFGRGDITLSSGRKSDFYFDLKPSMLDPEGASLIASMLLDEIVRVGAAYVGGLEMGAVPITGAVCQHSFVVGRPVSGFFMRKARKGYGADKLVEGLPRGQTLAGKRIVIVEDTTTTGDSALKVVEACRVEGADIAMVISIVDREEGAAESFAARGVPFTSLFKASEFLSRP